MCADKSRKTKAPRLFARGSRHTDGSSALDVARSSRIDRSRQGHEPKVLGSDTLSCGLKRATHVQKPSGSMAVPAVDTVQHVWPVAAHFAPRLLWPAHFVSTVARAA